MLKYSHNVPTIRNNHISIECVAGVRSVQTESQKKSQSGTSTKAWPTLTILAIVSLDFPFVHERGIKDISCTPHLAHGRNENFPSLDALRQRKGKKNYAIYDETLLAQYKQSCIKIRIILMQWFSTNLFARSLDKIKFMFNASWLSLRSKHLAILCDKN